MKAGEPTAVNTAESPPSVDHRTGTGFSVNPLRAIASTYRTPTGLHRRDRFASRGGPNAAPLVRRP